MMRTPLALCAVFVAFAARSGIATDETNPKVTLTFIWRAGDRANLLQKIARQYTRQTGVVTKKSAPIVARAVIEEEEIFFIGRSL